MTILASSIRLLLVRALLLSVCVFLVASPAFPAENVAEETDLPAASPAHLTISHLPLLENVAPGQGWRVSSAAGTSRWALTGPGPRLALNDRISLLGSAGLSDAHQAWSDDKDSLTRTLEEAGDVLQFALPIAGFVGTYLADDPEGRQQFYKSVLTAVITTTALKGAFAKLRPKADGRTSFPSGHTTGAFVGAGFIDQRYGHKWGSAAYALAALTGYSRVRGDHHFADDVLAGASIGLFSNWFWVTPHTSNVVISPLLLDDGVGVNLSISSPVVDKKRKIRSGELKPRFRYALAMGGARLKRNVIIAPADSGTPLDLGEFEKIDDPTTTARAMFQWYIKPRHTLNMSLQPFESRDRYDTTEDIVFDDITIPAGARLSSAWLMYDLRATWTFNLTPESPWNVQLGGGVLGQYASIELKLTDGNLRDKVREWDLLPILTGHVGYDITDRWQVGSVIEGFTLSGESQLDFAAAVRYRLNNRWDLSLGGRSYHRDVEKSDLINDVRYNSLYIVLGHTFY